MKISKLIIPLLGLTSINNANKQELQLEKIPAISYEVSVKDKWDNYYLTNVNTTQSLIQNKLNTEKKEFGGIVTHTGCTDGCMNAHSIAAKACCAAVYFPPAFVACQLAASAALATCIYLCNNPG